jgi:azurin
MVVSRRLLLRLPLMPLMLSACERRKSAAGQSVDLFIASDGDFLAFRPDTLECQAGTRVRLTFHHAGRFLSAVHNWVLVKPGEMKAVDKAAEKNDGIVSLDDPRVIAVAPMCGKGETVQTEFTAPAPGDYQFFCSTPGHAEDMNGILHVTL